MRWFIFYKIYIHSNVFNIIIESIVDETHIYYVPTSNFNIHNTVILAVYYYIN
jgi:hypothetical protein